MSCLVARVSFAPAISISIACTMARACAGGTAAFSRISSDAACTAIQHSLDGLRRRAYRALCWRTAAKSSAIVRICGTLVATAHTAITHPREGAAQRLGSVDDARAEEAKRLVFECHQPPATHRCERRKALPVRVPHHHLDMPRGGADAFGMTE